MIHKFLLSIILLLICSLGFAKEFVFEDSVRESRSTHSKMLFLVEGNGCINCVKLKNTLKSDVIIRELDDTKVIWLSINNPYELSIARRLARLLIDTSEMRPNNGIPMYFMVDPNVNTRYVKILNFGQGYLPPNQFRRWLLNKGYNNEN